MVNKNFATVIGGPELTMNVHSLSYVDDRVGRLKEIKRRSKQDAAKTE
jgi:hypothetical protein